ncbi:lipopolysaccharide export LptBFGC system permease protein LptF [Phyllobacterium ifriqiyense]
MQLDTSISQTVLTTVFALPALALACWVARYPRKTSMGILAGVVVAVALVNLASGIAAFLGYILPIGQMDYWLTTLIGNAG